MEQPHDMMTRFQTGSVLWRLAGAEAIQLQTDQLINLLKDALQIVVCLIMSLISWLMALILVPMTVVILVISVELTALAMILVGPILLLIGYQTQQANQLQNLPGPYGDMM